MTKVSIIMAAFDAAPYISESIRSVQDQTVGDWELIIADDGSTDTTRDIVQCHADKDNRIKHLMLTHSGKPGVARNAGLEVAQGRYISFLDADDLWHPERLSLCLEQARQIRDCSLLFHDFSTIENDGKMIELHVLSNAGFLDEPTIETQRLTENFFRIYGLSNFLLARYVPCHTGTIFLDSSRIGKDGIRFREDVSIAEDLDLWCRIARGQPTYFLNHSLSYYRKHNQGVTTNPTKFLKETIQVLESRSISVKEGDVTAVKRLYLARLKHLHRALGYNYLMNSRNADALRYYARGLLRYGDLKNTKNLLKAMLPWASLKRWLGRGDS